MSFQSKISPNKAIINNINDINKKMVKNIYGDNNKRLYPPLNMKRRVFSKR